MLAIPLITLQAVIEVAIGGFIAIFITDLTRLVTRGFLVSTGGVLLLIGAVGAGGEYFLPDPVHLTDHAVDHAWLQPSIQLAALFLGAFFLYLLALYAKPPVLHVVVGFVALIAGVGAIAAAALTFPTPIWGASATGASFFLSAMAVGTVTTAMLLGHWYLVSPNLSTRPLFILLYVISGAFIAEGGLAVIGLWRLAGRGGIITRHDLLFGGDSLIFWIHVGAGLVLPLAIAGMALQSTRLRSLMSATGLLYVAVVLALVGQITGKVVLFGGGLPL